MSTEDAFTTLKNYFEARPAARQALSALREGVEISVIIGGVIDCALFQQNGQPIVEKRVANAPDVVFKIRPETVYVLNNQPSEDIGDVGVAILKEMLAGNVSVSVPGSIFNIIKNGYLEIIRRGGARVSTFLATRGFSSVTKIIGLVKKIKG